MHQQSTNTGLCILRPLMNRLSDSIREILYSPQSREIHVVDDHVDNRMARGGRPFSVIASTAHR
ncbi:MAG: hypothetical protein JWP80_987 [Pseudomonas sp.]|nr:hypothetical protein [Pseudomonas sp.]